MELTKYQRLAWEFATPSARSFDYLLPGLVAEVGELAGKVAKSVRDGWTPERLETELVAELGDVAWLCAGIATLGGVKVERYPTRVERNSFFGLNLLTEKVAHLVNWKEWRLADVVLLQATAYALAALGRHETTREEFDAFLDRALAHNLAKLTSRRERGVIGGSGDHR